MLEILKINGILHESYFCCNEFIQHYEQDVDNHEFNYYEVFNYLFDMDW